MFLMWPFFLMILWSLYFYYDVIVSLFKCGLTEGICVYEMTLHENINQRYISIFMIMVCLNGTFTH
jgi:hypothetical protein